MRLSFAAIAAYGAGLAATSDPRPTTAALTALLIVQVTLVGTLSDTARRILSVLAGVAVAIVVATLVPFTWWSLGAVVAVSILLGQALRLGDHLLEVPISAMLILAAGGAGVQATDRVIETVVGAALGLLVNIVVPPSTRSRSAGDALEHYARRVAELLDRAAEVMGAGPPRREQAEAWLDEVRRIGGESASVDRVLIETSESRRLNPRAVGTADPVPDLRSGLDALEHSAVALRAVFRSIAEGAGGVVTGDAADGHDEHDDEGDDEELRRQTIAALLADLARSITAFGALVRSEAERTGGARADELAEALDAVRETRARIVELLLVDPSDAVGLWQLRGSLLAGIERVVAELDLEEWARRRERHRREAAALARPGAQAAAQAAARLRTSTRRVLEDNPLPRPRRRRD